MKPPILILFFVLASLSFLGMVSVQQPGVQFSHQLHIEAVELGCADCHTAEESTTAQDNLLPGHDNCYLCHEEDDTECSFCHTDADDPQGIKDFIHIARFPHAQHVGEDFECATCHAGVAAAEKTVVGRYLPSMQLCQDCHGNLAQVDYCYVCHAKGEELAPADHRLDWRSAHGLANHLDEENCQMCHTEKQCLDCHEKDNLDRQVHPLNYVNNHAIDAKMKADNCYTCHEELESCVTCHREQLVLPRNHNTAGWATFTNGGRHARQAKMDLDKCLACHNDAYTEPICMQCHAAK